MVGIRYSFVLFCFLVSPLSAAVRRNRNRLGGRCSASEGIPCGSENVLTPGSSFKISSKTCNNGNYPPNELCLWHFEVQNCKPSLKCDSIDLKGEGDKCLKDRLRFETSNRRKAFCRMDQFTEAKGFKFEDKFRTSFLDMRFQTDRSNEGSGFSCTVSCSEEAPKGPMCQCGIANRPNRIVGGEETGPHEYPWQVGIVSNSGGTPFCGGSLLTRETVLTAAHCTQGLSASNIKVVLGDHDTQVKEKYEKVVDVKTIIEHPGYNDMLEHDFAILHLKEPAKIWMNEITPVCLPQKSDGTAYEGVTSTVTGWGTLSSGGEQARKLMEVDVKTITNTECDDAYKSDGGVHRSMLCAKAPEKDACQGDSGGPLVTLESSDKGGTFYSQIGVVSWGIGCADPKYPGVYSRVTEDLRWIEENRVGNICPPPGKTKYERIQKPAPPTVPTTTASTTKAPAPPPPPFG